MSDQYPIEDRFFVQGGGEMTSRFHAEHYAAVQYARHVAGTADQLSAPRDSNARTRLKLVSALVQKHQRRPA